MKRRPLKVLILGHARHGKDTLAELLKLKYQSSSYAALEIFLFDKLNSLRKEKGITPYLNHEEAFLDRVNHRALWHSEIAEYNAVQPTRLASEILKTNDAYIGMRAYTEYVHCLKNGLFDVIFWIDASKRKPLEPLDSFNIQYDHNIMIKVTNNSSLFLLKAKATILRVSLFLLSFISTHFNYYVKK